MNKKDIQKIKSNLRDLLQIGRDQLDDFKDRNEQAVRLSAHSIEFGGTSFPRPLGMATILTDPENFLYQAVDAYWSLYEATLDVLEMSAARFMMRPLMDMCYLKVLYFHTLGKAKQKEIALKHWLCLDGLQLKNPLQQKLNTERYTAALSLLDSRDDKKLFEGLAQKGYPKESFHKISHGLLPSLTDARTRKVVEDLLKKIWGKNTYSAETLGLLFRSTSILLHAHPTAMKILESDKKNSGCVLHAAQPMLFTGITVIRTCEACLSSPVEAPERLEAIQVGFREYLTNLWKQTNLRT